MWDLANTLLRPRLTVTVGLLAPIFGVVVLLLLVAALRRGKVSDPGRIRRRRLLLAGIAVACVGLLAEVYLVKRDPLRYIGATSPGAVMNRARIKMVERHAHDLYPADPLRIIPDDAHPEVPRYKFEIADRARNCLALREKATVVFNVNPEGPSELVIYVAARLRGEVDERGAARFRLFLRPEGGERTLAARRSWQEPSGAWEQIRVDLEPFGGRELQVELEGRPAAREGALCLISEPRLQPKAPAGRPNLLILCIETLRRDHTSLHGYERPTTPFLEELAEETVVFEEAYAQSSWTRPAVASMLTGLYPSQHGARVTLEGLPDENLLLSEMLRDEGYVTAAFCTNELLREPIFNYDQGFGLWVDEKLYNADKLEADLLGWLDRERPAPFFAYLHFFDPHFPYNAPGSYRDMFDPVYEGRFKDLDHLDKAALVRAEPVTAREMQYVQARYDGTIRYTDSVLRRLVRRLKERGLWDNTLVIITADHGEEFQEHRNWDHAINLYPEKLAIPLLVKLPGRQHGGLRLRGPAGHVDLVPTVLPVLGMRGPGYLAGRDLLAGDPAGGVTGRRSHLAEFWSARCLNPETGRFQLTRFYRSLISGGQQLIHVQPAGPDVRGTLTELFDLRRDPLAQDDLAEREPDLRDRHLSALESHYRGSGYVLAANGGDGRRILSGVVAVDGVIEQVAPERLEPQDSFSVSDDGRQLRFTFSVGEQDDDVFRFDTNPAGAALEVTELELDGQPRADLLRVGPRCLPAPRLPLFIEASPGAVDAAMAGVRRYRVGSGPALHLWRLGTGRAQGGRAPAPDSQTIRNLKDLGYL